MRPLALSDHARGHLDILSVLTVVSDPGEAAWQAQFEALRAAPRTLFGSYCREHTRGRRLIVLALQATMESDVLKVSKVRSLFLGGRYDAQDPRPVGNGQASRSRKWVFFLRRFAERGRPR